MYVCVCNQVTDSEIREACATGAHSISCLKQRLKVATCCGRCEDYAMQVMREAQIANLPPTLGAANP